ncbi:MAG TPA: alpha/beta fold hydrolase [Thermoanaerobaculia bacterium]|nr:alpha/beta fold hydrolase [Thermoanaerobaculia bacterium]
MTWIVRYRTVPAPTVRLFCFPYAGGAASAYRGWASRFPASVDVCAVQLPGRETRLREAPLPHMIPVVNALLRALPLDDLPFAFFGHSMGALIAFELTRALRRERRPLPEALIVSGARPPQIPDPEPPTYNLPEPEFRAELRRLGGTPTEILDNEEMMAFIGRMLRADFALCDTYVYSYDDPLDVPIIALAGTDDYKASPEQTAQWSLHTRASFETRTFDGDHFYLQPREAEVTSLVARVLAPSVVIHAQPPQQAYQNGAV